MDRHRVYAATLLTGIALALVGLQGTAHAAFPGENGRIIYTANGPHGGAGDHHKHLYASDPDGSDKLLFHGHGTSASGQFSANGREIVYECNYGRFAICKSDAQGKHIKRLAALRANDSRLESPTFTPSGGVVFDRSLRCLGDECNPLWTMHGDGSKQRKLFDFAQCFPSSVSPVAAQVVASCVVGQEIEILRVSLEHGSAKILDGGDDPSHPDYSPNGKNVVYEASDPDSALDEELRVMRSDGTHNHLLVRDADEPNYSPDGKSIAFVRDGDIYRIHPDHSGLHKLIDAKADLHLDDWGPRPR